VIGVASEGLLEGSGAMGRMAECRWTAMIKFRVPPSVARMKPRSNRSVQIAPFGCGIGPELPVLGLVSALIRAGILYRTFLRMPLTTEWRGRHSIELRRSTRRGFWAHHVS
jgi:hypothetical protein